MCVCSIVRAVQVQNLARYNTTGRRHPHLANAAKYAFNHSVVLFGIFRPGYTDVFVAPTPFNVAYFVVLLLSTGYAPPLGQSFGCDLLF